jgi:hypothetical protein
MDVGAELHGTGTKSDSFRLIFWKSHCLGRDCMAVARGMAAHNPKADILLQHNICR